MSRRSVPKNARHFGQDRTETGPLLARPRVGRQARARTRCVRLPRPGNRLRSAAAGVALLARPRADVHVGPGTAEDERGADLEPDGERLGLELAAVVVVAEEADLDGVDSGRCGSRGELHPD